MPKLEDLGYNKRYFNLKSPLAQVTGQDAFTFNANLKDTGIDNLSADSVKTDTIADGAVTSPKLAANSVAGSHIINGAVGQADIASNVVQGTHIAGNAITGTHITDGGITGLDLAGSVVAGTHIALLAVTNSKINDYDLVKGTGLSLSVTNTGTSGTWRANSEFSANGTPGIGTTFNIDDVNGVRHAPVFTHGLLSSYGTSAGAAISSDGWNSYTTVIPTSVGTDDPTYTLSFAGTDITGLISNGMKIKLTQGSTEYFIITGGTFTGGNTNFTIYGGTAFDLGTATISGFAYSSSRSPFAFPLTTSFWTVTTTDTTQRQQATPTANTWYNPGTMTISIPIGVWQTRYKINLQAYDASSVTSTGFCKTTLSTANNSESDADFTCAFLFTGAAANPIQIAHNMTTSKYILLTSKTSYYLNTLTDSINLDELAFRNDKEKMVISAVSAYL